MNRRNGLFSLAAATVAAIGGAALFWQQATAQTGETSSRIPDFSSNRMMWVLMNGTAFFPVPGDHGPGPIVDMPGHEYIADYTNRVADTGNPVLRPWAKKLMDINNQR